MSGKEASVLDVIMKAYQESNSETVDLVIDHKELRAIKPEMFSWWGVNINDSTRYRTWCPEDHISFKWEVPPSEDLRVAPIQQAEERICQFPASVLRIRYEDPSLLPGRRIYSHVGGGSLLGPDNKPISWVCHECDETPKGMKMRSTFRFGAKIPKRFLNAMRKHCIMEMGHLPEFLPELYRQNVA